MEILKGFTKQLTTSGPEPTDATAAVDIVEMCLGVDVRGEVAPAQDIVDAEEAKSQAGWKEIFGGVRLPLSRV